MLAYGDDVELLVRTPIARLGLHRDQILTEVASSRIDGETAPISRFERDSREGTGGGAVALLGLGCSLGIEETACASDLGTIGCCVFAREEANMWR